MKLDICSCLMFFSAILAGCTTENVLDDSELFDAVRGDDIQRVKNALATGEAVDTHNADGETPLFLACKTGRADIVDLLLKAGASVSVQEGQYGFRPIHAAALNGHSEVAALLIAAGADVNAKDEKYGIFPLFMASEALEDFPDVVSLLIEAGANVNARTKNGLAALTVARKEGHKEVEKLLIAAGATE